MTKFWTVYIIRFVSIFFVTSVIIASFFFPGGNIHDPNQVGYSFSHNFLSELGGYITFAGDINNVSSFFFNTALFCFLLVGISSFFIPSLFRENKTSYVCAYIAAVLFFIGMVFFAGVALTPHDLYREAHAFFAINAFRWLIPASAFFVIAFFLSDEDNKYTIINIIFLISTAIYVIYQLNAGSPRLSEELLVQNVLMQKAIASIHVISIFSLTFCFNDQIKRKNL